MCLLLSKVSPIVRWPPQTLKCRKPRLGNKSGLLFLAELVRMIHVERLG